MNAVRMRFPPHGGFTHRPVDQVGAQPACALKREELPDPQIDQEGAEARAVPRTAEFRMAPGRKIAGIKRAASAQVKVKYHRDCPSGPFPFVNYGII